MHITSELSRGLLKTHHQTQHARHIRGIHRAGTKAQQGHHAQFALPGLQLLLSGIISGGGSNLLFLKSCKCECGSVSGTVGSKQEIPMTEMRMRLNSVQGKTKVAP